MSESFAHLLKQHRIASGLSQEALAERAGLSRDAISALERGTRRAPYRDTLELLVGALALSGAARQEIEAAAETGRSRGPQRERLQGNLPTSPTSLVGRKEDVRAVCDLLKQRRLVAITGSGGVGKTRVALEVGARCAELGKPGAVFVDLSALVDGALIPASIAAALDLGSKVSDLKGLTRQLRHRSLLLILDNCEHLIDDASNVVATLSQTCPDLFILATSRERLNVPGEAVYRLPSLTFPRNTAITAQDLHSYSALTLFSERAAALAAPFEATDANLAIVADICRRLEGIPLAIELAVARLPMLGLEGLRDRLHERFVLAGHGRGISGRQATMCATIEWSYGLLGEPERLLLNRVGIFAGGFTLEAAERVCADDALPRAEIASHLSSLIDKSLVNVSLERGAPRYSLLESMRAYALERLIDTGDLAGVVHRRASWLLGLVERIEASNSDRNFSLETDFSELDNIRAALRWAIDEGAESDIVDAGRIAGGLRHVWINAGRFPEGRLWSQALIDRIDDLKHPEIVAVLFRLLIQTTNDLDRYGVVGRAIPLFERIGDYEGLIRLQFELASFFSNRGRFEEAHERFAEAARIIGEQGLEGTFVQADLLASQAQLAHLRGALGEAQAFMARASEIGRRSDPKVNQHWAAILAKIEFHAGNTNAAIALLEQFAAELPLGRNGAELFGDLSALYVLTGRLDDAVRIASAVLESRPEEDGSWWSLHNLAAIAALRDDATRAARLLGTVDAWQERTGQRSLPINLEVSAILMRALEQRLSSSAIAQLREKGRTLSLEQAIDEAFGITELVTPQ